MPACPTREDGPALTLNAHARSLLTRVTDPVARGLVRVGVTANGLTIGGLVVTLVGSGLIVAGQPRWGAVVVAAGTLTDLFDGPVARLRGTAGKLGSFVDSVADRVVDGALLAAVAWLVRDDPLLFGLAMAALVGAQLTSYVRAKAESLGWQATVGLFERAERLIIVLLAVFFDLLVIGLWVLAIGTLVTVGQRLWVVWRQGRDDARREAPQRDGEPGS